MLEKIKEFTYYRWLIFSVSAIGTFMAALDASIVNVALPLMAQNLQVNLTVVQWVVSSYLLVVTVTLPMFGKIGDMYGRRRVFLLGITIFTAGSVLCALAGHIWVLVAARVVQAIGASVIMANSPAIVSITFPGRERGRALGIVSATVAVASMAGPALGGFLIDLFSWQSIFYINLPIGIAAYAIGHVIMPREASAGAGKFDTVGAVLFAAGMTGLLTVLLNGHAYGWLSREILGLSAATAAVFIWFVRQETRVQQPMIELALFKIWPFLASNLSGLLAFMAMFSNIILLPFYLHEILQLTPAQIGLAITPYPIMMALTAPLSGYLSERISLVLLTGTGMGSMMTGLLYLAGLDGSSALWQVVLGQALLGFGQGMFQSPNNNSILSSVPKEKVGLVSGMSGLMRNIGTVSGTAITVSVFENARQLALAGQVVTAAAATQAFVAAYHAALTVGAVFAGLGMLISFSRKGHMPLKK